MKKIVLLLLFFLVLYGAGNAWFRWQLRPVDAADDARVSVTIEPGWTTEEIAKNLLRDELIRSDTAFTLYTRFGGVQTGLQAGTFLLKRSMSVPDIIEVLETGKGEEMIITIPEGYTLTDIDALLAGKGLIGSGELVACANTCDFSSFDFLPHNVSKLAKRGGRLEGYLYPDTYFVDTAEFVPKFFLERLLGTFRTRVIDGLADEIAASDNSLHAIVTMASLVEEETRTDNERAVVAGILWKRLEAGQRLDVDAAVRYIVDKPTEALTVEDLNVDSSYNMRKLGGLPPGPIASPSLASVRATLNPQDSPYWYYLHGNDGQIRYARTNEEHNVNRYQYLR